MRFIRVKSVIIATTILVTNLCGGVTINAIDVATPSIETYWDIQLQTPNLGKYKFVIQAKEKPNTNKYKILKTVDSSYYPTTTMSYIKEVDNQKPKATYEFQPEKKLDVVYMLGTLDDKDAVEYSIENEFKDSLSNDGDVKVSTIQLNNMSKLDYIDWNTYGNEIYKWSENSAKNGFHHKLM